MEYILIAVAAAIFALFLGFSGVRAQTVPEKPKASDVAAAETKMLSRADIKQRLQTLAKSTPPEARQVSAMCYSTATIPLTIEYVCPKCGEKTLYEDGDRKEGSSICEKIITIRPCRNLAKSIANLNIELDESEFCRKCSPDVKSPQLNLVVKYEGEKEHRVNGISYEDLILINEFLSGSDIHTIVDSKKMTSDELPMKNYLARLSVLLGVEIRIPEKNEK